MRPVSSDDLQRLPQVGKLLDSDGCRRLVETYGRQRVVRTIRQLIAKKRQDLLNPNGPPQVPDVEITPRHIETALEQKNRIRPGRVINATGVVLHTNLGRAPLSEQARAAVDAVNRGYSDLEYQLEDGSRGGRQESIEQAFFELLNTESALVVNNGAAAIFLCLRALAQKKEVIVSRSELVEIGGGFRIPDILKESEATLVEVGTTNKVYVEDYARAITENTALILKVHRSNFALVGFVHEPSVPELVGLAEARRLPLVVDIGLGLLVDPTTWGDEGQAFQFELRPEDVLSAGASVVTFSGDKLLGGPQAGIIAGKKKWIQPIQKHPLMRALRADKMTHAALRATLLAYESGDLDRIPTLRMLRRSPEELKTTANHLARAIQERIPLQVTTQPGSSLSGGGALPLATFPTTLVLIGKPNEPAQGTQLESGLRRAVPPVIVRMENGCVALDPRTLTSEDLHELPGLVEQCVHMKGIA